MNHNKPAYTLNADGEFVIENYNHAKPFSNFFPGIAGLYGIPMWVFFVNRGQAISSCGTTSKDQSIMEFFPANKAWQLVSSHGFRTFIKLRSGTREYLYEPFHNGLMNREFSLKNSMRISSAELVIEEHNQTLGLATTISYFTIPEDTYAGLVRVVTIRNTSRKPAKMQVLDGMAQIVPYGTNDFFLKKMGRTIEAWMQVENLQKNAPFFRLTVDPTDKPEVIHLDKGNFYLAFQYNRGKRELLKPIVDPQRIFGTVTDLSYPQEFAHGDLMRKDYQELTRSKTPCAFSCLNMNLAPGEEKELFTIIGYMRNLKTLNANINRISSQEYLRKKRVQNKKVIADLQQDIDTQSANRSFDLYTKQTYLDNILRGGYPHIFSNKDVFYIYSRKHGDPERDYNRFHLEPTYFSQGNGNYRDANQNRRMDIWFHPEIAEENLVYFLNLIQTDGYNPLVVKGARFTLTDAAGMRMALRDCIRDPNKIDTVLAKLATPFTPGDVLCYLEDQEIKLSVSRRELTDILLTHSTKSHDAEHGEGFWIDHWHYNLDLLDSFLGVYPERLREIVFEKQIFTFYDNAEVVQPRSVKYTIYQGKVRQLHAVSPDSAKRAMINKRDEQPHIVRSEYGNGAIYQTTLYNKLLCLLATKLCVLDPYGVGIEMEANKPNWYDALNGLPALFGSSSCETFELKRLILTLSSLLEKTDIAQIQIAEEIHQLLSSLNEALGTYENAQNNGRDFIFWDTTHTLIEEYRHKTKLGLSGNELIMQRDQLSAILEKALNKVNAGLAKAKEPKKQIYCGYFMHEVPAYETESSGIKPTKFTQIRLPLFLEGQMHALRLAKNSTAARTLYNSAKSSPLYDKKLRMYKVTAPLAKMPEEIGRCRIFTPGWLENESIWLHMEYKYLLEILKQGLHEEFAEEFKKTLIAFQDPARYGRSNLENSSFLTSSAFPDPKLHGNGFVARLSGSTAEFLQIWFMMNVGKTPFFISKQGELSLRFSPTIPGWLFNKKGTYAFNFLRSIRVTYHNPKRKNTFGKTGVSIKRIIFNEKNGAPVLLTQDTIPAPYAQQIRERQISNIDIYLG